MHKPQEQVREFSQGAGNPTSPAEPKIRDADLRARLIVEEALETAVGLVGTHGTIDILQESLEDLAQGRIDDPSPVETVDGLCDLIYVAYGTAEALGVDLEPFFDEVHASNMQKVGCLRDAGGKLTKPANWVAPRIPELLQLAQHEWFRRQSQMEIPLVDLGAPSTRPSDRVLADCSDDEDGGEG